MLPNYINYKNRHNIAKYFIFKKIILENSFIKKSIGNTFKLFIKNNKISNILNYKVTLLGKKLKNLTFINNNRSVFEYNKLKINSTLFNFFKFMYIKKIHLSFLSLGKFNRNVQNILNLN